MITLTSTLVVKAGVTLATVGLPLRTQYAKQARLVRGAPFGTNELDSALVRLESGARLDSVWVSGQAQVYPYHNPGVNVVLRSGTGTTLANARLDNSTGWTSAVAHHYGAPCSAMALTGNLITGYSNDHHYTDAPFGYTPMESAATAATSRQATTT